MRASVLFAAPFVALAAAQSTNDSTESATATSSASYSNGATSFLTQTNSLGVVTGQPKAATSVGVAATNAAVSSAVVQLVPAGLSAGTETTLIYGNVTSGDATSIVVSIGSSSTVIVSAAQVSAVSGSSAASNSAAATSGASSSGSSASGSSGSSSKSTATRSSGSSSSGSSSSSSASSSSSGNAGSHVKAASGALIGAGAFFAAFM